MIKIPKTDLVVHELCLGGNVFGWGADEAQSMEVLSAYRSHGGNFIDTADVYSEWRPGNEGGESERRSLAWFDWYYRRTAYGNSGVASSYGFAGKRLSSCDSNVQGNR